MATELAKAYVQIVPSAEGISGSISKIVSPEADRAGKDGGNSLGSGIVNGLKTVLAAAGIGAIVKQALDAGGNLQQSFGGLDTIYGDAANTAKQYAAEAAKAGISMNSYAEQAVSFGASLKQAFEGDVLKSAEAANTAIMDMADNSAKMGTDIGMVQSAYQGFAKQNYTMLDNLKLGYGGTKTEMERLLADAEKLSGVKYDINNLGDVYDAIHVIQTDLGLTGVAAAEAEGTFTGSLGAMKASAENLLATLTTGGDVSGMFAQLTGSVESFVSGNLIPMLGSIVSAIPEIVSGVGSLVTTVGPEIITSIVTGITENLPMLLNAGLSILTGLAEGIITMLPQLAQSAITIIQTLGQYLLENIPLLLTTATELLTSFSTMITENLPLLLETGIQILMGLIQGIIDNLPMIVDTVISMIGIFTEAIMTNLPIILEAGLELILALVNGIIDNIDTVLDAVLLIIETLINTIVENLPQIIEMGIEILLRLIDGLIDALPQLAAYVPEIILKICTVLAEHLPEILQAGVDILLKLIEGVISIIGNIATMVYEIVQSIVTGFQEKWNDIVDVGKNIINGIVEGLKNAAHQIWDTLKGICEDAWESVKDFFGIESPSRLMRETVGKNIALGWAEGIEQYGEDVVNEALGVGSRVTDALSGATNSYDVSATVSNNGNMLEGIYEAVGSAIQNFMNTDRPIAVTVYLEGKQLEASVRGTRQRMGTGIANGGVYNSRI